MTARDGQAEATRAAQLAKMPKATLAAMHHANGGLMPLATYRKWTREELVKAVLEDEGYQR